MTITGAKQVPLMTRSRRLGPHASQTHTMLRSHPLWVPCHDLLVDDFEALVLILPQGVSGTSSDIGWPAQQHYGG